MKKNLLLTVFFVFLATLGFSQTDKFWSVNSEIRSSINTDKAVARLSFPKEFKLFDLNIEPLRRELFSITGNRATGHSTVISLPNAAGGIEQFEVFEASNFEPALQERFPEIRAFSGKGITDKYATLKLSISPQGIQTMVFRTDKANEFIEAYSGDHVVYAVFRSQRNPGQLPWTCTTQDKQMDAGLRSQIGQANTPLSNTGELRTMRLAQSCNGEYSNWFGAFNPTQVALVLAAFNATLTRCNGCYEKDLALHLNLIANTSDVIFYDPLTDPYTTLNNWNSQLQATLTSIIGEANYDIGHMFGASGGGGNAGCIGCVCVNGQKGRGITSPADNIPQGDNFDIDYVVHEVGHQLGGNHTFSYALEGTGQNKEVGAGITIMGYAGITNYDPAPHSIDIFHETSIQQIQVNLATKTCPITTNITANNATPVVNPVGNVTIPISTPFALTGSATDANGDPLTYCWEQNDNSTTTGANSVASPTKVTGPNWLTFPATSSPTRLFPKLSTILAGLMITPPLPGGDAICNIEALSSVSRTLNFRLTVRDNCPYVPVSPGPAKVGQTAFTDVTVTVTNTSGPFQVTSPNTNVAWAGGSSQAITWDVNNTNTAPVSCANVKISLSTDGGLTFPTVLAASTSNDGTETLTIPSTITTTARIKIEAVDNIFFDISNADFSITGSYGFTNPSAVSVTCGTATTANITLATTSTGGYNAPITLAATGNPAGTTVSYSVNPVIPGNSSVVTLNGINTLVPNSYPITITGTSGTIVKTVILTYDVAVGVGPAIGTQPIAKQVCTGSNTSFTVASAAATSYQWQLSTAGPGGPWTNIINGGVYSGVTTVALTITGATIAMNNYLYRVIVNGQCGSTNSNAAILTVYALPVVTASASSPSVCSGSTVTLTGAGADTYTWSAGTTPGTGASVTANPLLTTAYTVTGTVTATGCINTAVVTVVATPKPTLVLTASPYTRLMPGLSTTITATASSASTTNFIYTWSYTGQGPTQVFIGNTHLVKLADMGTYTVTAADASNLTCVSLPASINIADSASSKLFVFPSPNNGLFKVSYYSPGASSSNKTKQSITIYDVYGQRVHTKEYEVTQPYQLHQIDMRRNGAGVYFIVLREANGNKIKTGEVVIR